MRSSTKKNVMDPMGRRKSPLMKCKYCKKKISRNIKVCWYCGKVLESSIKGPYIVFDQFREMRRGGRRSKSDDNGTY